MYFYFASLFGQWHHFLTSGMLLEGENVGQYRDVASACETELYVEIGDVINNETEK